MARHAPGIGRRAGRAAGAKVRGTRAGYEHRHHRQPRDFCDKGPERGHPQQLHRVPQVQGRKGRHLREPADAAARRDARTQERGDDPATRTVARQERHYPLRQHRRREDGLRLPRPRALQVHRGNLHQDCGTGRHEPQPAVQAARARPGSLPRKPPSRHEPRGASRTKDRARPRRQEQDI